MQRLSDVQHIVKQATSTYELPIVTTSLRPAREVCERCHWPQKFYGDKIRELRRYAHDEQNTETRTYLVMKTRGGSLREGGGFGIHWHVENVVEYIATDKMKQNIPWVRATFADGRVVEYVAADQSVSPEFIASHEIRRMDCIDCHNRASHLIRSPESTMDSLLAANLIDRGIPYIKDKGVALLSASYERVEDAMMAIAALDDFYRMQYPQVYAARRESIRTAITQIQQAYRETHFPERHVTWETYPNNVGHKEFPGCFRCHDGRHIAKDTNVPVERLSIRLHCNVCHSLPVTIGPGERPPAFPIAQIQEPTSHLAGDWMAKHPSQVGPACVTCHGEIQYSAKPSLNNQSFCSNVACHGQGWAKWVTLIPASPSPATPGETPTPIPAAPLPSASPTPLERLAVPAITHPLDGRTDCLACHKIGGLKPFPQNHVGRTNDACLLCHQQQK